MHRSRILGQATVLVFIGLIPAIAAEKPADTGSGWRLYLRAATVDTAAEPGLLTVSRAAGGDQHRYVVQLDGPISPRRRARLEEAGVTLGDYLPMHAYVCRLDGVSPAALLAMDFVRWVGVYRREWKLDPRIDQGSIADRLESRSHNSSAKQALKVFAGVKLMVTGFGGTDAEAAANDLAAAGATIIATSSTSRNLLIDVEMPPNSVAELALLDWVQFVEPAPHGTLRNDTNEWIVQSNGSNYTPIWDAGIHGEGQVGGLIDGPVAESHCSFDDDEPIGPTHRKIIGYRGAPGSDSHGTHTAGTFVGDGGIWGEPDYRDGFAFAARLTYSSMLNIFIAPSTLLPRLADAHADGARVHSNSWGDDGTTAYTTWSQQIDAFSRTYEDSLVVFAVTNMSALKTPENAKNVLAVGATLDTPNQHLISSGGTGPTSDGRRKPEVYAPGSGTQSSSSSSSCAWQPMSGTSMACPAVSGAGLLVRQYFVDGYYPTGSADPSNSRIPTGALIKGVLINSAVDITGVTGYPGDREGWGRVLVDGALHFEGDDATLFVEDLRNADGLSTGESRLFQFHVTDSGVPLRVTLVWTDVAATVGTSFAPVNDLDLEVQTPGQTLYLGNVFDTAAHESVPGGARDDRNNVEQVHLLTPAPGLYQVEIVAAAVNVERQGFALVVTGAISEAAEDCNGNGVPDDEDISGGFSADCDDNTIPDECEVDFDGDGLIDACDPDIDNDGVPNDSDVCDNTPPALPVRPDGSLYGDLDLDCDVNLDDYRLFDNCIDSSGPDVPSVQPTCLSVFDSNHDDHIDLADFATLQLGFTGP